MYFTYVFDVIFFENCFFIQEINEEFVILLKDRAEICGSTVQSRHEECEERLLRVTEIPLEFIIL